MALSAFCKDRLAHAIGSYPEATAIAAVIDADGGSLSADAKRRCVILMSDETQGQALVSDIENDTAVDDLIGRRLIQKCGFQAGKELIDTIGA